MMMNNPVDLFAEYEALNAGFCAVEPGGYFTYISSSLGSPLTLCVSADGVNFFTQELSVNEAIGSSGASNPFIDFSGDSCVPAFPGYGGSFVVVAYNLPAENGCAAQSRQFTIWIVNNSVQLTRNDDACMYELWGVSPADGSDIVPDITMPSEWITPKMDVQVQVERRDVEPLLNECSGPTTLVYDSLEYLGTPVAGYSGPNGTVAGPTVVHKIQTGSSQSTGVREWGNLTSVTLGGFGTVSLGLVRDPAIYPMTTSGNQAYAAQLSTDLDNALGNGDNYKIRIRSEGTFRLRVEATCANSAGWIGIDKTSCTLTWCNAGGCPTPNDYQSTSVVTQSVSGDFLKEFPEVYEPCPGKELGMWVRPCPNVAELEIFDLANCNYNTLALQNESGRRYYIFDYYNALGENPGRQWICQTTTIEIEGTGCPNPPFIPVYSWQGGGANPKEFVPTYKDTAESECGGCVAESTYCLPEARNGGHGGSFGLPCQLVGATALAQNISDMIEDCDGNSGGAMTLLSLTVHDVPSAFTSCTTNAGTKTITSVHPSDILPRTYYYAYKYTINFPPHTPFSNYGLIRVNILPGNCCV